MKQTILGTDATLPIPTAFPDLFLFAALLFSTACTVPRFLLVQYGTTSSCCFSLLSKWALSRDARIALKTVSTSSALALWNDEQSVWKILHRPLQAACLSRAASMMGTEKLLNVLPTRRQLAHDYHSSYSTDGKNEALENYPYKNCMTEVWTQPRSPSPIL